VRPQRFASVKLKSKRHQRKMIKKEYSVEIGGNVMTAEFNDWANQASGSVVVRYGNTAVLATVVIGKESALDYFPLSVE